MEEPPVVQDALIENNEAVEISSNHEIQPELAEAVQDAPPKEKATKRVTISSVPEVHVISQHSTETQDDSVFTYPMIYKKAMSWKYVDAAWLHEMKDYRTRAAERKHGQTQEAKGIVKEDNAQFGYGEI